MKSPYRVVLAAAFVAVLCSCVTTSLSSYTDPAFTDATFDSVAVWTGTAKTKGDEFTNWHMVRDSAGSKVITELLANGLLPLPREE